MGLGLGIVLIIVGLVLATGVLQHGVAFAADTPVGLILIAAGALTLVVGLLVNRQRSTRREHIGVERRP